MLTVLLVTLTLQPSVGSQESSSDSSHVPNQQRRSLPQNDAAVEYLHDSRGVYIGIIHLTDPRVRIEAREARADSGAVGGYQEVYAQAQMADAVMAINADYSAGEGNDDLLPDGTCEIKDWNPSGNSHACSEGLFIVNGQNKSNWTEDPRGYRSALAFNDENEPWLGLGINVPSQYKVNVVSGGPWWINNDDWHWNLTVIGNPCQQVQFSGPPLEVFGCSAENWNSARTLSSAGITSDGDVLIFAVSYVNKSPQEMRDILQDYGVENALRFDSGGSASFYCTNAVAGCPSNGIAFGNRPLPNSLIVKIVDADADPPDGDYSNRDELQGEQFNDSVTLEAWASDSGTNASGVDQVLFRAYYGSGWHTIRTDGDNCDPNDTCNYDYTWNLDGVPDGQVTMGLDIKDQEGNWAHTPRGTFYIYKFSDDPPTIFFNTANGIAITSNGQDISSTATNWAFTGTASDNQAVGHVEYQAWGNNGNVTAQANGTTNWNYSRNGLLGHNRIHFWAYDNLDQRNRDSDRHYIDLYVDTAPPITTHGLTGAQGENGYYLSPVQVGIYATDQGSGGSGSTYGIPNYYSAGIDAIHYRVDGGSWQTHSGSSHTVTVSGDGNHTVEYYAVDNLGSQESAHSTTFQIDATPPTPPSGAIETHGVISSQWQNGVDDPAFTWNPASDATSGVAGYQIYWGDQPGGEGSIWAVNPTYNPAAVPTGSYHLRGRTRDNAGNWSNWVDLFTFRYDGTPPHNPEVVNDDGVASGTWQNMVRVADFSWGPPYDDGSGVAGYYVYWGSNEYGTSTTFTTANEFVSDTPICGLNEACTFHLRIQTVDNVGLTADWATAFALRYDNAPPIPELIANYGLTVTNQTIIRLDITATDEGSGVQSMRLSTEGTEWTDWLPFESPILWQLPDVGRRAYDILLQVADAVPNVSEIVSDTVVLDINTPQPGSENFRLWDDTVSAGGNHSGSAVFGLRSTIGQSLDAAVVNSSNYQIWSGYQAGALASPTIVPTYTTYLQTNHVIASGGSPGSGLLSPNYQLMATVGQPAHVNTSASANFVLFSGYWAGIGFTSPIPSPPPPPPPPPPPACDFYQISINDAALFVNRPQVILSMCAPDATDMRVSNDGGFGGATWQSYVTTLPWVLEIAGPYVQPRFVYIQYRDSSGQIHGTYFDDIIYDPNPPVGEVHAGGTLPGRFVRGYELSGVDPWRSVRVVNNQFVDLEINAVDDSSGVWEMQLSEDPNFGDAVWEPYTSFRQWAASPGDGLKAIYARFRDRATNESFSASDMFVVDTTPPTGTVGSSEAVIGVGVVTVPVNLTAIDELSLISAMRVSFLADFSDTPWTTFAPIANLPNPHSNEPFATVYAQFLDAMGNPSQIYTSSLRIDNEPPLGYAAVLPGPGDVRTVTLAVWDYESGVSEVWLSPDYLFRESVIVLPYATTTTWNFADSPVLYVYFVDGVGNFSQQMSALLLSPDIPDLLTPADNFTTGDSTPTFSWTGSSLATQYELQIGSNPNFINLVVDAIVADTDFTPTSPLGLGIFYWRVRAQDAAGNWTEWSQVWVFSVQPQGTSVFLPVTRHR